VVSMNLRTRAITAAFAAAALCLSCSGALTPPPGRSFGSEWMILATPLDTTQIHLGDARDLEGARSFTDCYRVSGAAPDRDATWSQIFSWNRATGDTANLPLARALDRGASFSGASRGGIVLEDPRVMLAGELAPRSCRYADRNGIPRLPAVAGLIGVTVFKFVSDGVSAKDVSAYAHGTGYVSGSVDGDTVEFVFDRPRWIGARYLGFTATEDDTALQRAAFGEWVTLPGRFRVACEPTGEKAPHGGALYRADWARVAADSTEETRGYARVGIGEWAPIGADSEGVMRGSFAEVMVQPAGDHAVAIALRSHRLVPHAFDSESSRQALREWIDR
jgi:hypothetical protein